MTDFIDKHATLNVVGLTTDAINFNPTKYVDAQWNELVAVVRCKDCKKYIPCQKLPIGTSKWCDLFDRATCEMNYCGWGERREDGLLVTDKD